eukprot:CAMPEP_0174927638 /NCGR_PEP_ID=MMETSP1355-20121228/19461_1 /TAXON_ID=464990 /ORGANISM="Hemiselmis tepida, Strain CCMP443" /LENGTH=173 /DNA_ID=CAMNT_0016173755 /DNA_START=28 /DNA_END=549 /DNA_ORIENTATION=+
MSFAPMSYGAPYGGMPMGTTMPYGSMPMGTTMPMTSMPMGMPAYGMPYPQRYDFEPQGTTGPGAPYGTDRGMPQPAPTYAQPPTPGGEQLPGGFISVEAYDSKYYDTKYAYRFPQMPMAFPPMSGYPMDMGMSMPMTTMPATTMPATTMPATTMPMGMPSYGMPYGGATGLPF